MRLLIRDVEKAMVEKPEEPIELAGWVYRIRELGGLNFVILRDRSGLIQLVVTEKPDLSLESVIAITGIPVRNEKAPGGIEIQVHSVNCISKADKDIPYRVNGDLSRIGLETVLDNRLLSVRNPAIQAIFKVQSTIIEAFSTYLRAQDFTEIRSSKLVGSGTEGGTALFAVEYFNKKLYLAQSPQFYKQTMVACGMERVFEVAQVYRAEKHDTPRHLNEYVSLDLEMAFIESEKDLIELEKAVLIHVFTEVLRKNSSELALHKATVPDAAAVERSPIISYEEALRIAIKESGNARLFDISPEVERLLCEWSMREYQSPLVFVNEFPRRHRPFYTYPLGDTLTMSFDTLFRGLEITSGSRRQHDYQAFIEALPRFGLKPEDMPGYLTLLKYGCPPHGGFAIGCERLTQKILGLSSVKEASLFPRDRKRTNP
ncbi:MAG: aspartate--tRNA(Asn) ligase [Spirochaetaceae bacterium]|jgi:nondiscriminating aspartyl-tRNA synthetase|nr:aspartate--tRNA(Asn) ligase [Spirochaetaceae bacterium]